MIFIKFASETWEGARSTIKFVPVPKETIEAALRVFRLLWMVEQTHVKAAYVVHIILDVVGRASSRTFTLVNLVSSVGAHIAINIQLVVANGAPTIA